MGMGMGMRMKKKMEMEMEVEMGMMLITVVVVVKMSKNRLGDVFFVTAEIVKCLLMMFQTYLVLLLFLRTFSFSTTPVPPIHHRPSHRPKEVIKHHLLFLHVPFM
jgi:hypothetical protein